MLRRIRTLPIQQRPGGPPHSGKAGWPGHGAPTGAPLPTEADVFTGRKIVINLRDVYTGGTL